MKRLLVVAAFVAVFVLAMASGALAGEVKGPPTGGTPTSNDTAGPAHANSLCVYNGLNDYINGQTDSKVQTPRDGGYPGAAAFGWTIPDVGTLSCNPNGPVTPGG
jgi:hypothetical protein